MQRKELNCDSPSFIGAFYIDNLSVCDDLIEFFKNNPERQSLGKTGDMESGQPSVNKNIKDSIDIGIMPNEEIPEWKNYFSQLSICVEEYIKLFPMSVNVDKWTLTEQTNIQYYPPEGGFKRWHTERFTGNLPFALRHLVFMTYLNDVSDQGETEFYHQKIRVKPEKGLTLIWPADWTHYHRGIPSPSQEKWIITGWFGFLLKKQFIRTPSQSGLPSFRHSPND